MSGIVDNDLQPKAHFSVENTKNYILEHRQKSRVKKGEIHAKECEKRLNEYLDASIHFRKILKKTNLPTILLIKNGKNIATR